MVLEEKNKEIGLKTLQWCWKWNSEEEKFKPEENINVTSSEPAELSTSKSVCVYESVCESVCVSSAVVLHHWTVCLSLINGLII